MLLEALRRIDLKADGRAGGAEAVVRDPDRDRYLITSLQGEGRGIVTTMLGLVYVSPWRNGSDGVRATAESSTVAP